MRGMRVETTDDEEKAREFADNSSNYFPPLARHNIYLGLKETRLSREDNLIRVSELVSDLCPRVIYHSAVAVIIFARLGWRRGPPCTEHSGRGA